MAQEKTNPGKREFNLDPRQKARLADLAEKELAITRGMIYNNLMAFKTAQYSAIANSGDENQRTLFLGVAGEVWDAMRLTKGDKEFINSELQRMILWEYPDELLTAMAEKLYDKLSAVRAPTIPQKALLQDLESALTIDGAPFA